MATHILSVSRTTYSQSSRGTSRINDWKADVARSFAEAGACVPVAMDCIRSFTSASVSLANTAFAFRHQKLSSPAERRSWLANSISKAMVVIPQFNGARPQKGLNPCFFKKCADNQLNKRFPV